MMCNLVSTDMKIAASELIINADGSIFHLHLRPEELADNIILVGDPGRVDSVRAFFEHEECVRENREFRSVTGSYKGKRITVLSTGIGTDNIDIVMTELDALANIDFETREEKAQKRSLNILRIGTSGAVQADIPLGSFVYADISIGCDGLLNWYAERAQVAMADFEEAFKQHCGWTEKLPSPYFVPAGKEMTERFKEGCLHGMTLSAPGFYGPQGRKVRLGLALPDMIENFESFEYKGKRLTNIEMESSAIAGLGALLGHNVGTICCIIANRHRKDANPDYKARVKELIHYALEKI